MFGEGSFQCARSSVELAAAQMTTKAVKHQTQELQNAIEFL